MTTSPEPFPYKNALVRVQVRLDLPEEEVQRIVQSDVLIPEDHPDFHEAAMRAVEHRVADDLPRFMEWTNDDPEVEADA